jgi:hypothetical protein
LSKHIFRSLSYYRRQHQTLVERATYRQGAKRNHNNGLKKKSKAIPVRDREGPKGCERSRLPHLLDNRLTDGGKVVSLTRRPRVTPPGNVQKTTPRRNLNIQGKGSKYMSGQVDDVLVRCKKRILQILKKDNEF